MTCSGKMDLNYLIKEQHRISKETQDTHLWFSLTCLKVLLVLINMTVILKRIHITNLLRKARNIDKIGRQETLGFKAAWPLIKGSLLLSSCFSVPLTSVCGRGVILLKVPYQPLRWPRTRSFEGKWENGYLKQVLGRQTDMEVKNCGC